MSNINSVFDSQNIDIDKKRLVTENQKLKTIIGELTLELGSYLKEQSKAKHWILALNEAINLQFPNGIKGNHLYLMSDNGSQPTSKAFTEECKSLGIKQVFTSYNNPKGNADTERFMRTMKEEIVWTEEWNDPILFSKRFKEWIHYYNHEYLHSSLGYNAPVSYEKMFYEKFNNHE